jgi:hypothetical protein
MTKDSECIDLKRWRADFRSFMAKSSRLGLIALTRRHPAKVARRFVEMVSITSKEAANTWSIDVSRRHPTFDPHDAARVKIVDFVLRP